MIREFEFYHGAALLEIVHASDVNLFIRNYPSKSNCSYVLNDAVGLYVKHSTKRMAPWQFTFLKDHQDEILEMRAKLIEVFILLVCNDDGVVCIDYGNLKKLLDEVHEQAEWIRITKKMGGMYTVNGKNGSLEYKVGRNEFPRKIIEFVTSQDLASTPSSEEHRSD